MISEIKSQYLFSIYKHNYVLINQYDRLMSITDGILINNYYNKDKNLAWCYYFEYWNSKYYSAQFQFDTNVRNVRFRRRYSQARQTIWLNDKHSSTTHQLEFEIFTLTLFTNLLEFRFWQVRERNCMLWIIVDVSVHINRYFVTYLMKCYLLFIRKLFIYISLNFTSSNGKRNLSKFTTRVVYSIWRLSGQSDITKM